MFIFWIIAKSEVFSIIVVSKNKRYLEFILYGWSLIVYLFILFCEFGTQSGRGEIRPQRNWVNSDCVMMLTCICVTCIAHC